MLNEFVYCPRLFYYEHVEGLFVESADTLRGSAGHQRVDRGSGALPSPVAAAASSLDPGVAPTAPETIHSRSVTLASRRLGVIAKLDLVEVRTPPPVGAQAELFSSSEVVPVDYKAGAPRESESTNELWPTDKLQLGLQILVLRDNGYVCREGVIYYRTTKQRVRLEMTADLEHWILSQVQEARRTMAGAMPPPLVGSPKCRRCSLAPVCLPDETHLLSTPASPDRSTAQLNPGPTTGASPSSVETPRRLMAARHDTRALFLNTPGLRIGRKDETLTIKDEDKLVDEVRLTDLHHVALFGNIQITTQAVQGLCDAEIPITYFSTGGWFYGLTRGHGLKNVFLRIEQFRLARDSEFCLRLARQFIHGKVRNHRTLLMRNHVEAPSPVLARLKEATADVLDAVSIDELLGIEGAAAATYFSEFSGMLKTGDEDSPVSPTPSDPGAALAGSRRFSFDFTRRNRRPPTDPINALLSLAYSLLSKDCTIAALTVGFDPYIGFFHQPRFGRPALALDIMEEFRPLIAESAVLSALNNRVIDLGDFVTAGNAVNLTPSGRKKFFQTYEQRMNSLLTHPVFDYKVSYRRALELQTRLLAKCLTGEIPEYVPLTTR
jgi:CRISPR-associated protein Cas1